MYLCLNLEIAPPIITYSFGLDFHIFTFLNVDLVSVCAITITSRGVAQPGSASGLGPEGRRFKSCRPDHFMIKAKIYIPTKNSMQSGLGKTDKWVIKFETENAGINPLMGWETSTNTLSELNLEFSTKELAIEYAKKNKIDFEIIEPQKRKIVIKSYADNFLK